MFTAIQDLLAHFLGLKGLCRYALHWRPLLASSCLSESNCVHLYHWMPSR